MSNERPDLAGVLLAIREAQQQIGLATLATRRQDSTAAEVHLRTAQQRATHVEIDLCRLDGVVSRDD